MHSLSRSRRSINIWPGFVDALTTLLLVVIFVLMVFMVAQFFLSIAISGKDEALTRLERSEEHTSELQSLMRISYAVFCLKKKNKKLINQNPKVMRYTKKTNKK